MNVEEYITHYIVYKRKKKSDRGCKEAIDDLGKINKEKVAKKKKKKVDEGNHDWCKRRSDHAILSLSGDVGRTVRTSNDDLID